MIPRGVPMKSFRVLFLILAIFSLAFSNQIKFEFHYRTEIEPRLSESSMERLIIDHLSIDRSSTPYYKVDVNVYSQNVRERDYLVAHFQRSDRYEFKTYRFNLQNNTISNSFEGYVETEFDMEPCMACPDPEVEALFSTCITEFPSSKPAIDFAASEAEMLGFKTAKLIYAEENLKNVKAYLSCPRLLIWGRVGHGNTTSILLANGQSLRSDYFVSIGSMAMTDRTIVLNSCLTHREPFRSNVMSANTYFYAGGDQNLAVGTSEKVFMKFMTKAMKMKQEMKQAFSSSESEVGYFDYGWTGHADGGPYHFKGEVKDFLAITIPKGGEQWETAATEKITWQTNVLGDVKIELLHKGSVKAVLVKSTANDGEEEVTFPKDAKAGSGYQIRVTSLKVNTIISTSKEFTIGKSTTVSKFPFKVSFDKDFDFLNGWVQDPDDDLDWILHQGPTPSRKGDEGAPDLTGPSGDHTTGDDKYIYLEASGSSPSRVATLISPSFNLKNTAIPVLHIWTHMYGDDMGMFFIDIFHDGNWDIGVVRLHGNKGDKWNKVTYSLEEYKKNGIRFRIRGMTGEGWKSDLALDDFMVIDEGTSITPNQSTSHNFSISYTKHRIYFSLPKSNSPSSIELYSLQGKILHSIQQHKSQTGIIPINKNLSKGTYLVRVKNRNFTQTKKIAISQ